ncbi:MAG TPA: hypothetical protein VFU29_02340 [Chitinophagaceae bacterium]|nr:hypothetical protein [Chitinophagaceae bacterium]
MDPKIRLYNSLLMANIVLVLASIFSILFFITSDFSTAFTQTYSYYFIIPLVVYLLATLFFQSFLRSKYPSNYISNKIEGFLYFFAIITICAALMIFLMISAFLSSAIDWINIKPNPMTNVLIYVAAPSFIVSVLSIIVIISSFRLTKAIRKNLQRFADQIKKFGTVDN